MDNNKKELVETLTMISFISKRLSLLLPDSSQYSELEKVVSRIAELTATGLNTEECTLRLQQEGLISERIYGRLIALSGINS